jgi:redox-sensitive bicupin YhaK (pirin superfamily)
MFTLRKSSERGLADHGWLKSRHSFSFADYQDPRHMGFGVLRVINEDRIQGGKGFGTHGHKDMEIISYVVKGALEHKDSMGNAAIIRPGEVQKMSAGTGVMHAEMNKLPDQETHFFQIWIIPAEKNVTPSYGQKSFEEELNKNKVVLVVSGDGKDGSIAIHQDANLYLCRMKKNELLKFSAKAGRRFWIQLLDGTLSVNKTEIQAGDALSTIDENLFEFKSSDQSEFMLFDLP